MGMIMWLQLRLRAADVLVKMRELERAREVVEQVFELAWYVCVCLDSFGTYTCCKRE